jgi:hypothetical protein
MNRGRQLPEPGDGRKPFSVLDESPPFTANDDASTCESPLYLSAAGVNYTKYPP